MKKELDLFGEPASPIKTNPRNKVKYREHTAHHHPQNTHPPKPGEPNSCADCRYCFRVSAGLSNFYKCSLDITASAATDIRLKWSACGLFQPLPELLMQYIHENNIKAQVSGHPNGFRLRIGSKSVTVETEEKAIGYLRSCRNT